MKKLLLIVSVLFLFSCSKKDDDVVLADNQELINKVKGLYYLRAAYTDIAIDLSDDGIPHTDLFKEIVYCGCCSTLDFYSVDFAYRAPHYVSLYIHVPTSEYVESRPLNSCLREVGLFYDYKIDFETEEVSLVPSDYWDDFAAGFQTEFLDLRWEDGVAYFTLKKEFYTSAGEWQEVTLYLEFVRTMDM